MHPRLAAMATLCRETAMPASVLVCLAAFGSAGIDNTGASVAEQVAPPPAADTTLPVQPPAIAFSTADVTAVSRSITEESAQAAIKPNTDKSEPDPIVTAALTNSPEVAPTEAPLKPADETTVASLEPGDVNQADGSRADGSHATSSLEALDQCSEDACINRYLWELYQRTPKEDSIRVEQQRKVSVKRKGRMVTVTRTFSTTTDEDFSWKDPKAADKAGMPAADYVIGGIDRDFKLRLFQMLRAADKAGLSPGITSGFRDDYRQSIASGLKAANDRSYHGGSFRGGYGHGLAADIVSVKGATRDERHASSETIWNWVDKHGQEFGIGRPYRDHDPPHVGPIDGSEYVSRRGARSAQAAAKPRHAAVARAHADQSAAKRVRTANAVR